MKRSLKCPHCGGRRIWRLCNTKEHAAWGPTPLGAPQQLAPLDAFLCDGCGYTEWYSGEPRKLQPTAGAALKEAHCKHCGSREHWLVARFAEADTLEPSLRGYDWSTPLAVLRAHGVAAGTFAVVICRGCGYFSWFACDLPPLHYEVERSCTRCANAPLFRINKVQEAGGYSLPVWMSNFSEIGRFYLDVCTACGFTDWFGERYRELSADGKTRLLLEGNP